ncbi:uncharacterized protein [Physcomitrium patens]|uniref:Nuclear receptor corepressor 1 n=1 Tax=Physcomitrium patens TaxID=3218 RepID=A0A2K1KBX4_PHYPA|nr:uncharacterized protein LOC112284485 isoform X3 [Physcomitrium patens]PNR51285.1 hypothetical protein PHYPA_010471 [Physcomitrium patens]|eukprot:XP_024380079.1 uncharacterized protein LOC112284485 isoform X3 [Physcomitrella patens]
MDKEVKEVLQSQVIALKEGKMEASLQCLSPLVQPAPRYESSSDRVHLPATMHSVMAETTNDAEDRFTRPRSASFASSVQPKSANITRTEPPIDRKTIRHIGRFEVRRGRFDNWDDHDGENLSWLSSTRDLRNSDEARRGKDDRVLGRSDDIDRKEERGLRRLDERSERDEMRRVRSDVFGEVSSVRGLTIMDEQERDRDREYRQDGGSGEGVGRMMQRKPSFSGPMAQFGSGKGWGVGDKKSELSRFERYGTGNRDGSRAEYEGNSRDLGFPYGWRRERSQSSAIARHSSFTSGNRSFGEHGGKGSLSVSSGHDSPFVTGLSSNQDSDHPSPSKRPRLGWGQGLAKYEKKVGDTEDVSPSVVRFDSKKDGDGEIHSNAEEVKKGNVSHEKLPEATPSGVSSSDLQKPCPMVGIQPEDGEGFSDGLEKREKNENKSFLWRDHVRREESGENSNSCALLGIIPRIGDVKNPVVTEEMQRLEQIPASPVRMKDSANSTEEQKNESKCPLSNGIEEPELNGLDPVSHVLVEDSESREKNDEVTASELQESESLGRKNQSLVPSVSKVEWDFKCSAHAKTTEVLGDSHQTGMLFTETLPRSVDTVIRPSCSELSLTLVPVRLNKSSICSEKDTISTVALSRRTDGEDETILSRESVPIPIQEKAIELMPECVVPESVNIGEKIKVEGVLELEPARKLSKSMDLDEDEDVRGVPLESADLNIDEGVVVVSSRSSPLSAVSEKSSYYEEQSDYEVATGGSSLQEHSLSMEESLMMENKENARLAGASFLHLLPENLKREPYQQLYDSPTEALVWQHNVETHKKIEDMLLKKISEKHHFHKFKERILTLRFIALKEAWKQEQKGLSGLRNRPKSVSRWDNEGRSSHGPPSQRFSLRLRPPSMNRLDSESDAAKAMKKLMKEPRVEALRPVLKMPAMILDEKERASRRFVSRNALVEDPVTVEMERKTLNPWTEVEKKIFVEKFALHYKNFKEIASHLQYKTTADCIEYYYRNQKSESFSKSKEGGHSKSLGDRTKPSTFLTPTAVAIKRNLKANCATVEALNVATMNMKVSQLSSQVSEHAKTMTSSNHSLSMPADAKIRKSHLKESKVLEVILPSGTSVETVTSSLISTPCSVSSTAVPLTDECKEKGFVKERVGRGPSATRSSHSEQHLAGPKSTRSTYLRRMSSKAATQEGSQWTDEERELFTSAVATHGKDFRLIAAHVGSKSQSQCKSFFSKTRKRLGLDELVEQFQANEAAAMLVQSFRHDAELLQEVKQISTAQMDASAGVVGHSVDELSDTAAAVSTLERLKEQSKCFANDMSDLSLVADAAAAMEEMSLMKSESPSRDFSNNKQLLEIAELAHEHLKVEPSNIAAIRQEGEDDSETTKSDDSCQVDTQAEIDIVVDQAAAALLGMSETLVDNSGLKRSKSEAKVGTRTSPVSVFSRSQSARLSTSSPPLHAVFETNVCLTSGRNSRQAKERVNSTTSCKPTTRDRPQDMQDAQSGRKGKDTGGGEPKLRREPTSWTQEEKEKFAVILQEHGKDWTLLHQSLPSKSLTQIKTYFQNSKARSRLPAVVKLMNVVRRDGGSRKRKAEGYESSRKAAELGPPFKQKVRANAASHEFDDTTQEEDNLFRSASVSGGTGVGVDILAYAARFGTYPGQPINQDTLSMNGMQHLARPMPTSNTYVQESKQDGHQAFRSGARPVLPTPLGIRPHVGDGLLRQLSSSVPSKACSPDLQVLSSNVGPQAEPPAAIHQVAQQVQQMLAQQQHLQKQLALLIQQQAALPQALLPQHQQATEQTLQSARPLEEKLQQVVQQLQQQQALAQSQEGEIHNHMHFQYQQAPHGRGILKVKPIREAISNPFADLAILPSPDVLQNQHISRNQEIQLQQQDHSLSLGMRTIPSTAGGSTAGLHENHSKTLDLQDSDTDTDTDCEGMGSKQMVAEDSHQRMSVVHSSSSGQQQGAAQSTTSTLSSDSEQVKSWDVKLFGQSLLSKPTALPSTMPRITGSSIQEFVKPNISSPVATVTYPAGSLSKEFKPSESLPSAFGRVGASSSVAEGQPTSWAGMSSLLEKLGVYGAWSTTSSLQLSEVTELSRKEPDSEGTQDAVTSMPTIPDRQHTDNQDLVLTSEQGPQRDDGHHDGERELSACQSETRGRETTVEETPFLGRIQNCSSENVVSLDAGQCQIGLDSALPASHMKSFPTVSAEPGHWGE